MRKIAPLHAEAERVQQILAELDKGIVPPVPVADMRAFASERSKRLAAAPPDVGRVENRTIATSHGSVPVRLYYPEGSGNDGSVPAYVYFHGGGSVVGDLDMVDTACRTLCRDAGIVVVSVDYRLAPEHKFPAGLNDALGVAQWVAANGGEVGIDTTRLAIGGDSAGGNLAAAVAQAIANDIPFRFQVLVYPVTDLTCSQPSYKELGTGYPLTADRMNAYIAHYLSDPAQAKDPRASPLLATSVADQPPALVILAGLDPLVDEGRAYAEKLKAAGIEAEIVDVPDHPHGFLGWSREAQASRDMLALIGLRLRERLHG